MSKILVALNFGLRFNSQFNFRAKTNTARHSYVTILKRNGADIAYISESLGHSDLKTTEAYLANFKKEEGTKNAYLLNQFK